jgi:hypothetical protein
MSSFTDCCGRTAQKVQRIAAHTQSLSFKYDLVTTGTDVEKQLAFCTRGALAGSPCAASPEAITNREQPENLKHWQPWAADGPTLVRTGGST